MTTLQELDTHLQQAYSEDCWSDEAILYAGTLVQAMTALDWQALQDTWPTRPPVWQHRCAETLAHATPQQAIPILLAMLHRPDDAFAITVADVLRTFLRGAQQIEVTPQLLERLHALRQAHPGVVSESINALLVCLDTPAVLHT